MNDLVLVLSAKETKKSDVIIIETYLCNNKFNAKKKYSGGIVRKVNVFDELIVDNFNNNEYRELQHFFHENTHNISTYQNIINMSAFCVLLDKYMEKKIFYFHSYKQDMNLICGYSIVNEYEERKSDIFCRIMGYDIWYASKSNEMLIIRNRLEEKKIINILPEPKVIFKDNWYSLYFDYGGIEVNYSSNEFLYEYNKKFIARQYGLEKGCEKKFISLGFKKKKENLYMFNSGEEAEAILLANGFKVEYNSKNEKNNKKLWVEINNSNDWFDLKLYFEYDNDIIDLGKMIDIFSNKSSVVVGKERIDIPKSIIENVEKIIKDDEGLKIPKRNVWTLLQIADEQGINVNKFVSYDNIMLEFDEKIESQILEYQRSGTKWLKWLYKNQIGGCLADDMGVGKTFQTIALLSDKLLKKEINKVLIIVPYVLMTNWLREFERFSNEKNITIYHGDKREQVLNNNNRILITTYATATSDIELLATSFYDIVIFDEIQYIKNNLSKTYNALCKISARTRIGLSGTPLENRVDELWNILSILNPDMLVNKRKFIKQYKDKDSAEFHKLLAPFLLRRTKEEVLNELPEKREEIVYCDFSANQRKLYESIKVAVKESLHNYSLVNNAVMLKGLLLLRQACCHPALLDKEVNIENIQDSCKFESMKLKVEKIVSNGKKVVIFSQFVEMLQIIRKWCEVEKYKCFYIDGKTTRRQEEIDEFEKSKEGIFLISLKAGGVGLNLTSANYVIIFEPWWNPFAEQQAQDRIFRIGQKQNVTIYKMIASDSIEEKILNLQNSKKEIFYNVMSGVSKDKVSIQELIKLL